MSEVPRNARACWLAFSTPAIEQELCKVTPAILDGVVSPDTTPCRVTRVTLHTGLQRVVSGDIYTGLYLGIQPRVGWPEWVVSPEGASSRSASARCPTRLVWWFQPHRHTPTVNSYAVRD